VSRNSNSNGSIDDVVHKNFPKVRPALPVHLRQSYEEIYLINRTGSSAASKLSVWAESWMHRKVASDLLSSMYSAISEVTVLEIGAGTLNHLNYEKGIKIYDIVEPQMFLLDEHLLTQRIRNHWQDIENVDRNLRYDRIVSIATFEHLEDLPVVLARAATLLKSSGCLRIAIPNEGSLLWYLAWRCTTGIEFLCKYRADYAHIMRHEHVNTASEILTCLRYFFNDVLCQYFGLSRGLSLYHFIECRSANLRNSSGFLK